MSARYFASPAAFRAWLSKHHAKATELLVGFHKAHTGKPTLSWSESVDEALCFGWIDGVRKRVDDERYTIRFTPRKAGSIWSAINIKKMKALEAAGKMTDAGRAAFAKKQTQRSVVYSHENEARELPEALRARLDAKKKAAHDFDARPPWYRRAAVWWVLGAKHETTRERRFATLLACHARGDTVPPLTRAKHL